MEKKKSRDHVFYAFSPDLEPAMKVAQGKEFFLETHDCFSGQLKSEKDLLDVLYLDRVNPATGPVFIEGVQPGVVMRVDLDKLDVAGQATMMTVPEKRVLGDRFTEMETAVLKYKEDQRVFRDRISILMSPIMGVISVAPAVARCPSASRLRMAATWTAR